MERERAIERERERAREKEGRGSVQEKKEEEQQPPDDLHAVVHHSDDGVTPVAQLGSHVCMIFDPSHDPAPTVVEDN